MPKTMVKSGNNMYRTLLAGADFSETKLEDFISVKDKERLKYLVGDKSIKKGIVALYFSKEDIKKEFYRKLNKESLENICHLFRLISVTLKKQRL